MRLTEADEAAIAAGMMSARATGRGWMRMNCPFCLVRVGKADHRKSFGVHPGRMKFGCFKCGAGGKLRSLEAPPGWVDEDPEAAKQAMEPPPGFAPLWEGDGAVAEVARPAREYLVGRGLGPDMWRAARIGATLTGRFFGRVVVPIFGSDNETWLGWVGRAWVKKAEVPYLYPKGMPRGLVMYRQHVLLEETDEPALCVEGVMDALCAATWPHGTAFLGHESPAQVQALVAAKRPVVQVPDGDAWEAGWALTMRLRLEGQRAGCVRLPPRTDPDEVGDVLRDAARRSLNQIDPVRV